MSDFNMLLFSDYDGRETPVQLLVAEANRELNTHGIMIIQNPIIQQK